MPFINTILPGNKQNNDTLMVEEKEDIIPQESRVSHNKSTTIQKTSSVLLQSTTDGLSAIEELKSSMESIAAASEQSAGASEESLSAVNIIKESMSTILKMSAKSVENIKTLERSIFGASDKINDSSENMLRIAKSAESVAEVSARLNKAGEEVSQTVALITKLAKRTSLLALNAAIEASRAEEKGQGFSVIAKEIRTLSSKSNNYALEIKNVVEEIQHSVLQVEATITSTKSSVEESAKNATQNALSMKELIKKLLVIIEDVNKSLEEFKNLDNDVITMQLSSESIASASEETAGAVSEVTQTISMQATAFSESNKAAKMLESLAHKLNAQRVDGGEHNDLASSAEELSSAIEEIENSMAQIMVAFSQIEEAANISQDDATKNVQLSTKVIEVTQIVKETIQKVNTEIQKSEENFQDNVKSVTQAGVEARENLKQNESILADAKKIKRSIKYLKKFLRKIELTIVQTASLSINGSVEAMQVKSSDTGCSEGFSVVSNDIRNLAQNSEESLDKINDIVDNLEDETESIIEAIDKMQLFGIKEAESLIVLATDMDRNTLELKESVALFSDIQNHLNSIEHSVLEAKIGAEQTVQAADLALKNAQESNEAAAHITSVSQNMAENVSNLIEVAALLKDA